MLQMQGIFHSFNHFIVMLFIWYNNGQGRKIVPMLDQLRTTAFLYKLIYFGIISPDCFQGTQHYERMVSNPKRPAWPHLDQMFAVRLGLTF